MLQNATPALILLVVMLALAWGLKRWRAHLPGVSRQGGPALRVLSSMSLGPQQRVVTVQVGQGSEALCLVLGVAPGGVSNLHTLPLPEVDIPHPTGGQLGAARPVGFAARLAQFTKATNVLR